MAAPRRLAWTAGAALLVVAGLSVYAWRSGWSRGRNFSAIEEAALAGRSDDVFRMLQEAHVDLNGASLSKVAMTVGGAIAIETDPPAMVALRRIGADPSEISATMPLGRSPIASRKLVAGEYLVDISGDGLLPVSFIAHVAAGQELRVHRRLARSMKEHDRMVQVDAGTATLSSGSSMVPAFLIDAYEVTNEDFARFVTSGGYANATLWPDTFLIDGLTVPRRDALGRFVDRTKLPGPRGWARGTYPDGKARHPVSGVSWYEAAAFARWAGKELPAYEQWWRAAMDVGNDGFPWGRDARNAEKRANFSQDGTRAVGAFPSGISPFGCYDMAGNVREWLRDAQPSGARHGVTGGSWLDPPYMFEPSHVEWYEPSYANEAIGFRLVAATSR